MHKTSTGRSDLYGLHDAYTDDDLRAELVAAKERLAVALSDGAAAQRRVFEAVLDQVAGSAFGVAHGLAGVRSLGAYREAVPLRPYRDYDAWMARAAEGEPNVLTRQEPKLFFTTSGSTGARKRIPVTEDFVRQVYVPYFRAAMGVPAAYFPGEFSLGAATLNLRHDRLARPGTTGSGRPSLGPSQADLRGGFGIALREPGSRAPWAELPVELDERAYLDKLYVRLRMAVEHDVRCVIGHNPTLLAMVPELLAAWWPRILRDVRDGTFRGLPGGVANPGRAVELERCGPEPSAVWPRIRLLYCWTSGVASLYLPRLAERYGRGVTVLPAPAAASEGPVGVPVDDHPAAGALAVSSALYEFVDADDDIRPDSPTLLWHEVEPGRDYHVVFSHVGGLYRYVLGDVAQVVDRVGGVPRVRYAGRAERSDVVGERLREAQVVRAVAGAAGRTGWDVVNVTCRPEPEGGGMYRYAVAAAFGRAVPDGSVVAAFEGVLDEELCRTSRTYRGARAAGRLGAARLLPVPSEAFVADWHRRVAGGMRPPEVKDQVFQRDTAGWELLTRNVRGGGG
ncbi:GH3 family domain-containing protein [Streptomyces huasconensis]|uniref:GH3 family domain-containing protein n=1 Tax=Streptomyces huasconensis TaxID=1854574 RepID=UPI0033F6B700